MSVRTEVGVRVVATMEAEGGMRSVAAQVVERGRRFSVEVDGLVVHQSASADSAFGQMAHHVERKLENPGTFGVTVRCGATSEGFVYGSMRSGGGGGDPTSMSTCWQMAHKEYDDSSLSAAMHHAVHFLRHCCG